MGVVKSKKMQGACNVVWKKRLKKDIKNKGNPSRANARMRTGHQSAQKK
jgi:hypothetical protein